ncbi:hypothetical protein GCM10023340_41090 [Nocardioides marinquilinus]|uniref:eCIS core domain-containing protein n=1 Tax=Nocardioides marinquilinus TaxID=1210400 RepID=A0ABP9Q3V7_9ACTN
MPPTTAAPEAESERERERPTPAPAPAAPEAATLEVGAADHHYEQAADATADRVLRRLAEQGELGGEAGTGGGHGGGMGREGGAVDEQTAGAIARSRGGGAPLSAPLRRSMEGAFGGADFSRVRLHTGPAAGTLSRTLGATAFTVGNDVFLGSNAPSLDTRQGQHLLAHELTHTQQEGGDAHRSIRRLVGDEAEHSGPVTFHLDDEAEDSGPVTFHLDDDAEVDDEEPSSVTFHLDDDLEDGATAVPTDAETAAEKDPLSADPAKAEFDVLVTGSKAIASWRGTGPVPEFNRTTGEKAELGLTTASATGTVAAGAGSQLETSQGGSDKAAVADGRAVETAAPADVQLAENILGAISAKISVVKTAYKAVKDIVRAIDERNLGTGTVARNSLSAVKASVDLGQAAMKAVNAILEPMGMVTGPMMAAVPGLGIAIGVLDILSNGIALGIAYNGWARMRDDKREAKKVLFEAKNWGKTKKWYGGNESGAELAALILQDAETFPDKAVASEVEAAKDYQLSKSLQEIGGKRIRRNLLNISAAVPGIAGDIAMLTGVGAGVGAGLKLGGSALKGGAALTRLGKQGLKDAFGIGGTTAKKLAAYDGMIMAMSNKIISVGALGDVEGVQDRRDDVTHQVMASGLNVRAIKVAVAGNAPTLGADLWRMWVKALKNRDGL